MPCCSFVAGGRGGPRGADGNQPRPPATVGDVVDAGRTRRDRRKARGASKALAIGDATGGAVEGPTPDKAPFPDDEADGMVLSDDEDVDAARVESLKTQLAEAEGMYEKWGFADDTPKGEQLYGKLFEDDAIEWGASEGEERLSTATVTTALLLLLFHV